MARGALTRKFTDHPASAGETYFEHMRVAFGIARQLAGAAGAAAIHGVVPSLHETTASRRIHRMHECLENGDRAGLRSGAPGDQPVRELGRTA